MKLLLPCSSSSFLCCEICVHSFCLTVAKLNMCEKPSHTWCLNSFLFLVKGEFSLPIFVHSIASDIWLIENLYSSEWQLVIKQTLCLQPSHFQFKANIGNTLWDLMLICIRIWVLIHQERINVPVDRCIKLDFESSVMFVRFFFLKNVKFLIYML